MFDVAWMRVMRMRVDALETEMTAVKHAQQFAGIEAEARANELEKQIQQLRSQLYAVIAMNNELRRNVQWLTNYFIRMLNHGPPPFKATPPKPGFSPAKKPPPSSPPPSLAAELLSN